MTIITATGISTINPAPNGDGWILGSAAVGLAALVLGYIRDGAWNLSTRIFRALINH